MKRLWKLLKGEEGLVAIEYAVIAVGIAIAIVTVVGLVGDQLNVVFNTVLCAITP